MSNLCQFTVIQYVPDPLADERLNIGVAVIFGDNFSVRFLHNWSRVRKFSDREGIGYIKNVCESLESLSLGLPSHAHLPLFDSPFDERSASESLLRLVNNWFYSVQFTTPQPSLEEPDDLLSDLVIRYLKEPAGRTTIHSKTRTQVVSSAVQAIRAEMSSNDSTGKLEKLLHTRHLVAGDKFRSSRCDIALVNGRPYSVAQAVSFQSLDTRDMNLQWRDAVSSLADLRAKWDNLEVALLYAKPTPSAEGYQVANDLYRECLYSTEHAGIKTVEDTQSSIWAREIVRAIPTSIANAIEPG